MSKKLLRGFSAEQYEALYQAQCTSNQAADGLRYANVLYQRTKIITAGPIVYVSSFPIWNTRAEAEHAKASKKESREAQKKLNAKNAKIKLEQRMNANFGPEDLCITLTYNGLVPNEEQARRDIQNYIRRVRARRSKDGLPEMKYIYVIEFEDGEGNRKRVHHHVVMSKMDRDAAEQIWTHGRANSRRLQPDAFGIAALSRYIVKSAKSSKRWSCSKNLIQPEKHAVISDRKIGKRKAERLAKAAEADAAEIFREMFPNHQFLDCVVQRSDYVAGAYIYARLRRPEEIDAKRGSKKPRGSNKPKGKKAGR